MKKLKLLIILFLASLYTTVVLAEFNKKNAVLLGEIVAEVNDGIILSDELEIQFKIIKSQLIAKGINLNEIGDLKKKVLEQIILDKLQKQKAKQLGIIVTDEKVAERIRLIAKNNQLSLEGLRDKLNSNKNGFIKFRNQLRNEILLRTLRHKVVEGKTQVSEEEINGIVKRSKTGKNWNYNIGHIMLSLPESSNARQRAELRQKIEAIRTRILQGEDFSQMAVRFSQGSKSLQGGDLGWLKYYKIPTFFSNNVIRLKVGEISDIIRSPIGFHIIKLIDKKNENSDIKSNEREQAIQSIRTRKANESIDLWLRKIRGEAFVKIKVEELKDKPSNVNE